MKLSYSLFGALLLLSSCSTYQLNLLSSSNSIKDEQTGKFNMENDTVKITYSFTGKNAPMQIGVYNKLNEPLYIDWQRSALIVGDTATSFGDRKVPIAGDISGLSAGNHSLSFSDAAINAQATLPANVTFLPPHTMVNKTTLNIASELFIPVNDSGFVKQPIATVTQSNPVKVKVASYTINSSPASFKSYLTLYTLNDNLPKYVVFVNDFFVSKIFKSRVNPEYFEFYQGGRADYVYTSKLTGYGKASTGAAVGAVLVGLAALDVSQKKEVK